MTNPLTQDPNEAWDTIREMRDDTDTTNDDELSIVKKADAVAYWTHKLHQADDDNDAHEVARLFGWLDEITGFAEEVHSELEDSDA